MTSIDALVAQTSGLEREDLERWIANDWVRPESLPTGVVFRRIDVARVRLILEMRDEMEVDEAALPIVLLLLDQLYDLRRRMREMGGAVARVVPLEVQRVLAADLARSMERSAQPETRSTH